MRTTDSNRRRRRRKFHRAVHVLVTKLRLAVTPYAYRIVVMNHKKRQRLTTYLKRILGTVTINTLNTMLVDGRVRVNTKRVPVDYRVQVKETIDFLDKKGIPKPEFPLYDVDLEILYEDDALLVINKTPGILVHPSYDLHRPNILAALIHSGKISQPMPFQFDHMIVHRLDIGTTGVLIAGKTRKALMRLKKQFRKREVVKRYVAIAQGTPENRIGMIHNRVGKPVGSQRRMVMERGKEAITGYRIVESRGAYSLFELDLFTGRTHQIRIHLSWLGHPIVGDRLYDGEMIEGIDHPLLHAQEIEFTHPISGNRLHFHKNPPVDFMQFWDHLS